MKVSANYLSVVAAAISGVVVTFVLPILATTLGVSPDKLPAVFQWHMFFGIGVGLLVLAASVAFNSTSLSAFSLAGAVAAMTLTFMLFGLTDSLISLTLLIIAGMLVGAGQYLGARWLNTVLKD